MWTFENRSYVVYHEEGCSCCIVDQVVRADVMVGAVQTTMKAGLICEQDPSYLNQKRDHKQTLGQGLCGIDEQKSRANGLVLLELETSIE